MLPGQQIQGTAYTTTSQNWRRIAHIISDVIYERLLGEKGYFDTRVVYVCGTGPRDRRTKRLAIMDQDGENNRFLTDGSWLVLTPRFHPTRDQIVYMSYNANRPRVWTFDLGSGRQSVLGDFDGMTFAPRYAPDGNSIIMSIARGAGSDIVTVGLGGGGPRVLTSSGSIDTSPCYSPDGSQIVFNSDRGGDQQLYVMGSGGGGARRISYGRGRYATPVWSPRGDLIAFTRLVQRQLRHRRHAPRRLRRADPLGKLLRRGPDLLPQRPRPDVLPREPGARPFRRRLRLAPRLDRHHRLQRARRHHADRRLRPGLVAPACLTD